MKKHDFPGVFIVFEGLDGAGSSTQAELATKYLNGIGIKTFKTKEPTDNLVGGLIRGVLTHQWKISNIGLQLLYAGDRCHHLENKILPILKRGQTVVCDRYIFSSAAFGSIDCDEKWLLDINEKFILPDITFFIDTEPKNCVERISQSRDGFELFEKIDKLEKTRMKYIELSENNKYNIVRIDGSRSIETVSEEIKIKLGNILRRKYDKVSSL